MSVLEELVELEPRAPVWIADVRVDGASIDLDRVLASVTVRHGRDTVDGPIQSTTATVALRRLSRHELKAWQVGGELEVEDTTSELLFTGVISDTSLAEDAGGDPILTVVASSTLATAGLRQVAGHAWPAELWASRVARILDEADLAGVVQAPSPDVPIAATVPEDPEAGSYAATDALSALGDALADVNGTAFELGDGSIVVQAYAGRAGLYPMLELDPAVVLYSPDWAQTLDVKNRIVLGYGYGAGTVTVDEPLSQARYGLRWTGAFTSGLADQATADDRALDWLDRNAWPRWTVPSVTVLEPVKVAIGQMVLLDELPAGAPFAAWNAIVEGWTDTIEGADWTVDLVLSDPIESGLALPWQDVPSEVLWQDVDPACRWADAYNIGNLVPEAFAHA